VAQLLTRNKKPDRLDQAITAAAKALPEVPLGWKADIGRNPHEIGIPDVVSLAKPFALRDLADAVRTAVVISRPSPEVKLGHRVSLERTDPCLSMEIPSALSC
jgi:hypothetical protein